MTGSKFSNNSLLSALAPADRKRLAPHLDLVSLMAGQSLEKPDARIDRIFFMESGVASVASGRIRQRSMEIALIGQEGMTGAAVVLGGHRSPNSTDVQVAGKARCILAAQLCKAMDASPGMRTLFLRYVHVQMVQTAGTAAASGCATIKERLARWILMAHDRSDGGNLPVTHEALSGLLGIRRAGVTQALNDLKYIGLIQTMPGCVVVVDRKGLKRRAGNIYGTAEAEYRRLIG